MIINIDEILYDILLSKGYINIDGSSNVDWIVGKHNGECWEYTIYDYRKEEEIDDLIFKEYKEIEYAMSVVK